MTYIVVVVNDAAPILWPPDTKILTIANPSMKYLPSGVCRLFFSQGTVGHPIFRWVGRWLTLLSPRGTQVTRERKTSLPGASTEHISLALRTSGDDLFHFCSSLSGLCV